MSDLAFVRPGIRELTVDEVNEVSGGIIPILVFAGGVLLGASVVAAGYYIATHW